MKKTFTLLLLFCSLLARGYPKQVEWLTLSLLKNPVVSESFVSLSDSVDNQQFARRLDKGSVTVYPNPFQGVVQVTLPAGATKIEIRNMVGQIVFSQENVETTVLVLYLGHLASGPYFMSVFTGTKHELLRLIRE